MSLVDKLREIGDQYYESYLLRSLIIAMKFYKGRFFCADFTLVRFVIGPDKTDESNGDLVAHVFASCLFGDF